MRAARPEHKWVLCLDDDIELHPRSLGDLVAAAEADSHVFMATGEAPGHVHSIHSIARRVPVARTRLRSGCTSGVILAQQALVTRASWLICCHQR